MRIDTKDVFSLFGRAVMSGIFLAAGTSKFLEREAMGQYMKAKNVPLIPVLRPASGAVELFTAASLLLGYKTRAGALTGILFLIPTSLIFHDFWNQKDQERVQNQTEFLKNLAIIGGLVHVLNHGPGRIAIERSSDLETPVRGLKRELSSVRRAA